MRVRVSGTVLGWLEGTQAWAEIGRPVEEQTDDPAVIALMADLDANGRRSDGSIVLDLYDERLAILREYADSWRSRLRTVPGTTRPSAASSTQLEPSCGRSTGAGIGEKGALTCRFVRPSEGLTAPPVPVRLSDMDTSAQGGHTMEIVEVSFRGILRPRSLRDAIREAVRVVERQGYTVADTITGHPYTYETEQGAVVTLAVTR